MVDSKKAPFIPDEKQQLVIESARKWAITVFAYDEFIKENPDISKKEVHDLTLKNKNPLKEAADAKIPNSVIYQTLNDTNQALKSGELRPEVEELKASYLKQVTPKQDPAVLSVKEKDAPTLTDKESKADSKTTPNTAKVDTPLNPQEKEAIEKVKAFAKEYELRYAAVADLTKDNPALVQANPNKIMEYMAIPNPIDALDPRNPLAGKLKKAYNEAIANTKEEIEGGRHDKTIENMKKSLLDSFTPKLQKSEIEGANLPDHIKGAARVEGIKLLSNLRESGVNPEAADIRQKTANRSNLALG